MRNNDKSREISSIVFSSFVSPRLFCLVLEVIDLIEALPLLLHWAVQLEAFH